MPSIGCQRVWAEWAVRWRGLPRPRLQREQQQQRMQRRSSAPMPEATPMTMGLCLSIQALMPPRVVEPVHWPLSHLPSPLHGVPSRKF